MEPTHLPETSFKRKVHNVIFGAESAAGKAFDVVLIVAILLSVAVVMLDSVQSYRAEHIRSLLIAEWVLTGIFTVEYILRLWCVDNPKRYATSFFGLIDLLAILPTFVALILPGAQYLVVIRVLRILRIFRVLKLATYMKESNDLMRALYASRRKITVFVFAVFTIVIMLGALMYLAEGQGSKFTSIPMGVYWAVTTLSTVGYGDIAPETPLGRAIATIVMIMGYGIIAVPTGIVTAELTNVNARREAACPKCESERNPPRAAFCCDCGHSL